VPAGARSGGSLPSSTPSPLPPKRLPPFSKPVCSYYIEGCNHGWFCPAPKGPLAFVLSLTRWQERGFKGGELVMLQPNVWETDEVRWHRGGHRLLRGRRATRSPDSCGRTSASQGFCVR
jgi:hypothetical protein